MEQKMTREEGMTIWRALNAYRSTLGDVRGIPEVDRSMLVALRAEDNRVKDLMERFWVGG